MLVIPVTIVLGLVLSLAEFAAVRRWERDEMVAALDRDAAVMIDAVQSLIRDDLSALRAIGVHYSADRTVERGEFRRSAASLLSQFHGIQALAWVPRVRAAERDAFEEAARREGDEGFQITEQGTPGGLVRAGSRDEYFPVRFAEPWEGNQAALGFDAGSSPVRLEALGRARDTGQVAATGRAALGHEGGELPGCLVAIPVYRDGARLGSVEDRRANLEGFVLGVFRIGDLVESALSDLDPCGIDLALYDTAAPKENRLLAAHASRTRASSEPAAAVSETDLGSGPRRARTLDVAGRQWLAVAAPAPAYAAARATYWSWEALGLGLAVTGVLAAYLVISCRRGARIEALAADLLESNRRLEDDVARREQAEESARREAAKLSAMISVMEEGVVFADAQGTIVEVNDYFCRFVNQPREDILGKTLAQVHRGEVLENVEDRLAYFRANPEAEPFILQRAMGPAEVVLRMQPIYHDGRYSGVLFNVVDVTEFVRARREAEAAREELAARARELEDARAAAEQANRKLEQLATTDDLTSLWNRRHFLRVLDIECLRAARSETPLALAMLDLDHFKTINDTYGHALGDRVLAEVAAVMKSDARATDVIARYGGEEFMILMPDTSADEALIAAERLRRRVADHLVSGGPKPVRITVSIGISAAAGGPGAQAERLLRQADEALYAAKQAGRNCTRIWNRILREQEQEALG
jgi:diguanylate cyclase (GGDEF)-like protein/PAS domain S-box-containing protein